MRTVHIYQVEVLELEYTDRFHAHIEFESVKEGLRCDVTLVDNDNHEKSITIATAISSEYEMEELHNDAIHFLKNKSYCIGVFNRHCR